MNRVMIAWCDDDGRACCMSMSAEMAERCKALAESKALPLDAIMEILAGRAYLAMDIFLKANAV